MKQKRKNLYRKIALLLCFVFCLECFGPVANVFAEEEPERQTSTETETHNKAKQTLGSYETTGIQLTDPKTGGQVVVPIVKTVQQDGDKVLTTNSVDVEWLKEYGEEYGVSLKNFEDAEGGYKFEGDIQYDVVTGFDSNGNPKTVSVIGEKDMLAAPQKYWDGAWSTATIKNIKGTNASGNSIMEGVYYCTPTPSPSPTPPVETPPITNPPPTKGPSITPVPTNAPIPDPEIVENEDPVPPPAPTSYKVVVYCSPEEGGSASGGGTYNVGDQVTISATANEGYYLWAQSHTSFTMPAEDVYVHVIFKKKEGGDTGTDNTVDPTPTNTPKPSPSPTPVPQTYNYYISKEYYDYQSTTNGYAASQVNIANGYGVSSISLENALAEVATRHTYDVGTDANGNEWYFIKNDSRITIDGLTGAVYTATSVHPKKYNGHSVNSSAIRFINELTFPNYITLDGKDYYVYSIGGAGSSYYSAPASHPAGTISSTIGQIQGSYSNNAGNEFSYLLGVIGSGTVTSKGKGESSYVDYDTYIYHNTYIHNYYVYNTTLTTITIPTYCATIEDYAFHNCQALLTVNGSSNLKTIGKHSFSVAEIPELKRSRKDDLGNECIYAYDGSYVSKWSAPFTDKMYDFQERVSIPSYMEFPRFYKLQTIGESAFENRHHLYEVGLWSTVTTIHQNAFKNCKLTSISIPNKNARVYGDYETLGQRGKGIQTKTMIMTPVDSPAYPRQYGETYSDYYRLMSDVYIHYMPNGGTPIATKTVPAELKYMDVSLGRPYYAVSDKKLIWLGEEDEEGNRHLWQATYNGSGVITGGPIPEVYDYNFYSLTSDSTSCVAQAAGGYSYSVSKENADGGPVYFRFNAPSAYEVSYTQYEISGTTITVNQYYGGNTYNNNYSLGDGEIIAVRAYGGSIAVSDDFRCKSIYIDDEGYIHSKFQNPGTTPADTILFGGKQFKKCVAVNTFLAPLRASWSENGSNSNSSMAKAIYAADICIAAIDMDGYLYVGTVESYGEETSLTKIGAYTYSDITRVLQYTENIIEDSGTEGVMSWNETWTQTDTLAMICMLGTDKNVYYLDDNDYKKYLAIRYESDTTTTYTTPAGGRSGETEIYIDNYNIAPGTLAVKPMNFPKDVEGFLDGLFIKFTTDEFGVLTNPNAVSDIFGGVEIVYDISENLWFTKAGYDFADWNTATGGNGTVYKAGDKASKRIFSSDWDSLDNNLMLYAQWTTAVPKPKYIYYDANGGYGTMETTTIAAGSSSFTMPANGFSKNGSDFKGYFTEYADGTGKKYYPGQNYTTDKSMILYAQWTPYTYKVSFAYDDIRVKPAYIWNTATVTFDQIITMPGEPFKKKCVIDYNINTTPLMSTAALAKWETPYPFSEDYTTVYMKFKGWHKYQNQADGTYKDKHRLYEEFKDVSGLSSVKNDHITMFPEWGGIESYVLLPYATCPGYELYGYMDTPVFKYSTEFANYVYENGGGMYMPRASETLYVWWEPLEYTVLLDSSYKGAAPDTTGDTSVVMTFDKECPEITAPTLEHYVFMGYYTKPDGQGEQYYGKADKTTGMVSAYEGKTWKRWDTSSKTATADDDVVTTLYAYWMPDKEIRYEPNYAPLDADCREAWSEFIETEEAYWILKENEFTRTGYHFAGWNTAADGNGTAYSDKAAVATSDIDGVVVFYAQWKPNEYTVQYAPDGIEEDPVIPEPGPEDIWEYDEEYTISGQPFEKFDLVSYDLNRADKSTVPEMITELKNTHTKSVYRFIGWQLYEKTAGGYQKLNALFMEGETVINLTAEQGKAYVLFPVWKEVPDGVTLPKAQCKGFNFHGWTESRTEDGMLGTGTVLTSPYITKRAAGGTYSLVDGHKVFHTTLYAYWTPKQYEVILDDRGATSTGHTESVVMTFDKYGPDIIVPEKTGYIFQGYYTGIRGAGTKYYDTAGSCVKPWTEDNVYVLFACWVQEEVKIPEIGDRTPPEELPETDVEGSVGRTDGKGLLYADDYNPTTDALTDLQPYLAYDTPGSEGAIPGTEMLAFRAKMGSWMLNYKFHCCSGTDQVRIYVAVPYRTQYEEYATEKLIISPVQTKTYSFMVPKAWSYWEVLESGMYYPERVEVTNAALKGGNIAVDVNREGNGAVEVPSYKVTKHGAKENHVFWMDYDADGTPVLYIILEETEYIISNIPDRLPEIDNHLKIVCENAAWADDRQASVKSDRYEFAGEVVLSDELNTDGNGFALQAEKLPADEEAVKLTSYLQTYQSGIALDEYKSNGAYGTTAVIIYVGDEANVGTAETKEVGLYDINSIRIHTPVACKGVAVDGIEDGAIILRNALNFFTLCVDNTGTHRMSLGYGTKDFSFALSGMSNAAEDNGNYLNQVKFPFDVYVDVGNNSLKEDGNYDVTEDYYLAAGTWLTVGMKKQRFYIPVTQKNGTYRIEFCTIAVNCPKDTEGEYLTEGVRQEKVNLQKETYVATDSVEVKIKSYLKDFIITDTNDPTALLWLEEGCQALTLKKGYEFTYQLLTQGEFYGEKSKIEVLPSFFWVSEDGSKRQEVELYRMVKLPAKEWTECYAWEGEPLLKQFPHWNVILQRWCGNGFVPSDVLCIEKGSFNLEEYTAVQTITGKEDFFKQSGYLVLHFDIRVKSEEGIWYEFTEWNRTKLAEDALAAGWNYVPGDVIRYDLSKSTADDYEVGGVE